MNISMGHNIKLSCYPNILSRKKIKNIFHVHCILGYIQTQHPEHFVLVKVLTESTDLSFSLSDLE